MIFWDTSAILPLCIDEPHTKSTREMVLSDPSMVVWWGTPVECASAFARLRRERIIGVEEEADLRNLLSLLSESWVEVIPSNDIRSLAKRSLSFHPLTAADALQLSAALIWAGRNPQGHGFACLDNKLRDAASREGFILYPEKMN